MTEKEFRKLNKRDLLEMLIFQTKRADDLQASLDEANAKLESREISFTNAGSLAEASIRLNGVFEAADAAIAQYLESLGADGVQLAPRSISDDPSQMQAVADAEARLRIREAELQRREAACAERERALAAGIAPVQSAAAVMPQQAAPAVLPNARLSEELEALKASLDERKAALDEREKSVSEREFYCTQAFDSFTAREQSIAQREAAVSGREAECTARESAFASREAECTARESAFAGREAELDRRTGNINSYIFALFDQMKKVTAECDGIKQIAAAFSEGCAGAAVPSAEPAVILPEEGSSEN